MWVRTGDFASKPMQDFSPGTWSGLAMTSFLLRTNSKTKKIIATDGALKTINLSKQQFQKMLFLGGKVKCCLTRPWKLPLTILECSWDSPDACCSISASQQVFCLDLWSRWSTRGTGSPVHKGRANPAAQAGLRLVRRSLSPAHLLRAGVNQGVGSGSLVRRGQERRGEEQEQEVWQSESFLNLSTLLPRSLSTTSRCSKIPPSYSPPSGGFFAWRHRSWHSLLWVTCSFWMKAQASKALFPKHEPFSAMKTFSGEE